MCPTADRLLKKGAQTICIESLPTTLANMQ